MERQALVCPICGAPHRRAVPSGAAQVKCSYCGAAILVPTNAPRCPNHPDLLATAVCNDCGRNYCRDCLTAFEVGGDGGRGTLQLCSNCLSRRLSDRAVGMVLMGILFLALGLLSMLVLPIVGILFIVIFAVPIIAYGVYSARSSQMASAFPSESTVAEMKSRRTTQRMYQDTVAEFIKSFGAVHGILMLENRIEAYMNEGLSRDEAVRRIVEDLGY